MKDESWAWVIKTPETDLSILVIGPWTQAEAAKVVWKAFAAVGLPPIIGMTPRKQLSGDPDGRGVIYVVDGELGFSAGRKFWRAAGRVAEYEAQHILAGDISERVER